MKSIKGKNIIWQKYGPGAYDGWLYKETAGPMFTGSDITYIYNDYRTVIHGYFQNGYLVEGQASKIIACRCTEGM